MTLPSFLRNHKRSKSAKENEKIKELGVVNGKEKKRKEKNQEVEKVEDKKPDESDSTATTTNRDNGPELRDSPLWKLPGFDTQRRHSTSSLDKDGSPKPPSKSTTQQVSELPDTPPKFPEHVTKKIFQSNIILVPLESFQIFHLSLCKFHLALQLLLLAPVNFQNYPTFHSSCQNLIPNLLLLPLESYQSYQSYLNTTLQLQLLLL